MSLQKHARLVELLLRRSNAGVLEWKEGIEVSTFQVSFKDKSVRIRHNEYGGRVSYEVDLINEEAAVVDTFSDEELDREDGGSFWFSQLRDLFEVARRTALGSEKVLNDILSELEDDIPF